MIFMLRHFSKRNTCSCSSQEKGIEQNMGLYAAFIDKTKAFDTVSLNGLWKNPGAPWLSPKISLLLRQLHESQQGQVKHNGSLSGSFPIPNSVKQGCVLAPTLFSIFFNIILRAAKVELPVSIYICFRTDDSLFNLRRLFAHTKTIEELITELLFADDCTLLAQTEEFLQQISNHFSDTAKNFGLTMRKKCCTNPSTTSIQSSSDQY